MAEMTEGTDTIRLPGIAEFDRRLLVEFLKRQRWFAGKSRAIDRVEISAAMAIGPAAVIALTTVQYLDGGEERYFLTLANASGETAEKLARESPELVVTRSESQGRSLVLHEGLADESFCRELLALLERNGANVANKQSALREVHTSLFKQLRGEPGSSEPIQTAGRDQSNSAVTFGNQLFLKIFRKVEPGINPDFEIARYLTEKTSFDRLPRVAGALECDLGSGSASTLATLLEWVPNDGAAWDAMLRDVATALELGDSKAATGAELLGKRTAEMHLALATATDDPAFAAEPLSADDCRKLADRLRQEANDAFRALSKSTVAVTPQVTSQIEQLLKLGPPLVERFATLLNSDSQATKIRIHGDYHLGQVLCRDGDFVILDFEGEPARSLAERRAKDSPLRDVAGMLRSFGYAAYAGLFAFTKDIPGEFARLERIAQDWQTNTSNAYLKGYLSTATGASFLPTDEAKRQLLLDFFTFEKALYELLYELNNRPDWLPIPLAGTLAIASSAISAA